MCEHLDAEVGEAPRRGDSDRVEVDVRIADGLFHVYQLLTWLLPEARESLDEYGKFIRTRVG